MNFQQQTISIFQEVYQRLTPFHTMIKTYPTIIAYSGGKDSTLLCNFYRYLFQESKSPEPVLFHLDHSIRNNAEQEKEIESEMKNLSSQALIKKKTFQNLPTD